MATRTIANAGGNWNTAGTWVENAIPTASDDVVATATSGQLTIDAASVCRSIDLTIYTNTLTHNAFTLSIGTTTANGTLALKFPATGWTYTLANVITSAVSFVSTSATQLQITTGGKTFGSLTFNGAGGSWQLQDSVTTGITATLTLTAGNLDLNGQTISVGFFTGTGSTTRSLTMGSSTVTCTGQGGAGCWVFTTVTNLTFSAGSSTVILNSAGGSSKSFAGGGLTYFNLSMATTGSGGSHITGNNTFNNLAFTGNAKTCDFTAGSTQTITGTFSSASASGKVYTLKSTSVGTAWTLSQASGTVSCDFLSLQDSAATGGAAWYAGANSTNVSGNSGWIFTAPPIVTGATSMMMGVG